MRDLGRAGRRGVLLGVATLCAVAMLSCSRQPDGPEPEPEGLWSMLKKKATDAVAEAPGSLAQKAVDEAEGLLRTLNEDYAPVLREAGFEISEVRVSVGVPPGVALRVRRLEVVGQSREEEILAEHADDETLAGILRALFALNRFEAEGYELREIMVHSDLPPRLTLILVPATA